MIPEYLKFNEDDAEKIIERFETVDKIGAEERAAIKDDLMNGPDRFSSIWAGTSAPTMGEFVLSILPRGRDLIITEQDAKRLMEALQRFLDYCEMLRRNREKDPFEWINKNCN